MVHFPRPAAAVVAVTTAALAATLAAGCAPGPHRPATVVADPALSRAATTVAPAAAGTSDDRVNRVVAISVDGLNPKMIRQLGPAGAPNFHRLMREGTGTLNARTAYEQTKTLPNHTGMLTGRRITASKAGHGWTRNDDNGSTVHTMAGRYISSVFDVVHDSGGSTALYSAKAKFAVFARTWNSAGGLDRVGRDNGRAKISRVLIDENDARLVTRVTTDLRTRPATFSFVHIALPDEYGHAYSFMGRQYRAAVQQTDRLLGQILDTIAASPTLRSQTMVILTADHGGEGATHSDASKLANYRVPFLAWGPWVGVARGVNLYRMSPVFASPGSRRPTYSGKQPVRNGDLANLATDVLDLPVVPGSRFDAKQKLNVFR